MIYLYMFTAYRSTFCPKNTRSLLFNFFFYIASTTLSFSRSYVFHIEIFNEVHISTKIFLFMYFSVYQQIDTELSVYNQLEMIRNHKQVF